MSVVVITGSAGLIGSEASQFFCEQGFDVIGIDNDLRAYFFGPEGSTQKNRVTLESRFKNYHHQTCDIRDYEGLKVIFEKFKKDITLVIHTAAQPSHDWSYREPITDFQVNAVATLNLLEMTRLYCPEAVFIYTSTNKVYGNKSDSLPLLELETRYDLDKNHSYYQFGYDEQFSIDHSKHSIFGVGKVASDLMVQEYAQHFHLKAAAFRGSCLTGPQHSSVELHGFLSYLVKCAVSNKKYRIFGHKGKQVRDNIHSSDMINAFWMYYNNPSQTRVYNLGGSRQNSCSVLEAIHLIEEIIKRPVSYEYVPEARIGDPIWLIGDNRTFEKDYPAWKQKYDLRTIIAEMVERYRS